MSRSFFLCLLSALALAACAGGDAPVPSSASWMLDGPPPAPQRGDTPDPAADFPYGNDPWSQPKPPAGFGPVSLTAGGG